MGLAARKLDAHETRRVRPHLRLVPSSRARRGPRRASRARSQLAVTCCVVLVALAMLGIVRVSLAVRATEAAIDAKELQDRIRAAELESTVLEADRSQLAAPSRIEAIASNALGMRSEGHVRYIALTANDHAAAKVRSSSERAPSRALDTVLDIVAGEAQVLLVGDVGLASSR